jgi:transposase
MKKILKQVAGIDVAKKELVVSLGNMDENLKIEIYASKTFLNTTKGFKELTIWVSKLTQPDPPLRFVMEATGVYHEQFAYYLVDNDFEVSIILPNKISNFSRTLEVKTVTDKTASRAITTFGLERTLEKWQKPHAIFRELKQLTRERDQLVKERAILKNQLHAENSGAHPNSQSIKRIKERIAIISRHEKEIKNELSELVKQNQKLKEAVTNMCSLPGVGILTATTVLAETNGFELIRNKKQLTSFAGLDVKEKESGTSVKAKPRISKKGNRHLRKVMHMPALTAIKHDDRFKAIFARIVGKTGIKMKAVVAVQRKLLELLFILFKSNNMYNKNYLQKTMEMT